MTVLNLCLLFCEREICTSPSCHKWLREEWGNQRDKEGERVPERHTGSLHPRLRLVTSAQFLCGGREPFRWRMCLGTEMGKQYQPNVLKSSTWNFWTWNYQKMCLGTEMEIPVHTKKAAMTIRCVQFIDIKYLEVYEKNASTCKMNDLSIYVWEKEKYIKNCDPAKYLKLPERTGLDVSNVGVFNRLRNKPVRERRRLGFAFCQTLCHLLRSQ